MLPDSKLWPSRRQYSAKEVNGRNTTQSRQELSSSSSPGVLVVQEAHRVSDKVVFSSDVAVPQRYILKMITRPWRKLIPCSCKLNKTKLDRPARTASRTTLRAALGLQIAVLSKLIACLIILLISCGYIPMFCCSYIQPGYTAQSPPTAFLHFRQPQA